MELFEKTLESKNIYNGCILNVECDTVELLNGKKVTREIIKHTGAVCVAALTNDNDLLFVKQYRYPLKEVVLELPAGKLELGEELLAAAKRELQEETGAVAEHYVYLDKLYTTPAFCDEVIHIYFCRIKEIFAPNPDEDELLEILKIPIKDSVNMILQGKIPDAKTQVTVLKTYTMLLQNLL